MAERPDVVVLKNVRCSFPKYFTPEASVPGGPVKFGGQFIIDPDSADGKANIKALNAAIKAVAVKAWVDKSERIVAALAEDRKCLREGDKATNGEGDVYDGYAGMMYVSASNKKRPQILNRDKTPLAEEDGVIYGGCFVDAVISLYATTKKEQGGNGLFASLEIVRFRKDGDSFGAGKVAVDDYLDDLDDDDVI